MKIAIDATYTLHKKTGIGCYTNGLIDALINIDRQNNYTLFYNCIRPEKYGINRKLPDNFKKKVFRLPRRWLIKLWDSKIIPADFLFGNPDVFVCTGLHLPYKTKAKVLSIVYDVSFLTDDMTYSAAEKKTLNNLIKKILEVSDFIITCSENTKNDLIKFYNYSSEKIEVIYGALTDIPETSNLKNESLELTNIINGNRLILNNNNLYFLFVGSLEKRKNLKMIVEAARILNYGNADCKFVFAGKPDNDYPQLKELIEHYNLTENIIITGYIDENEKWQLYKNCAAVLYPSVYEGFGYPVLEAYAFNKPIITTRRGSIPELAGDCAFYVEPDKPAELAAILRKISTGGIEINFDALKTQAAKFDWRASAFKFIETLKKI